MTEQPTSDARIEQDLLDIQHDYEVAPQFTNLRAWVQEVENDPNAVNPYVPGVGSVRPLLVLLGEAPGAEEAKQGIPFVGKSGQLLRALVEDELGIDPDDCYVTNVVKYRPRSNSTPGIREIIESKDFLARELVALRPRRKLIVPLGQTAWSVFDPISRISMVAGQQLLPGKNGWDVAPMFHPAYALRNGRNGIQMYRRHFKQLGAFMSERDELLASLPVAE